MRGKGIEIGTRWTKENENVTTKQLYQNILILDGNVLSMGCAWNDSSFCTHHMILLFSTF